MPAASALDWSLVQTFLAVAEHGSLSAAARKLGATQPTVGRQIHAMEEQLGVELFQRHDKGLALTNAGSAMLGSARAMRDAVKEIELQATGRTEALAGTVRVTASVAVAVHHLPPILAQIREREPLICIELDPNDETSNLHYREADIAIRMYRPAQLDLVTQHLGDLPLAAFASRGYIEKRGCPKSVDEILSHDFVGFDRSTQIIEGFQRGGLTVDRDFFKVRTDDQAAYWALVKAGIGIGFTQREIGQKDVELVEIPLDFGLPRLPLWLTAHEAIHKAPRVRRVWEFLAEGLRALVAS